MWGSWIFASIPFLLTLLGNFVFPKSDLISNVWIIINIPGIALALLLNSSIGILNNILFILPAIIILFLFGWGIHSLIRRFK